MAQNFRIGKEDAPSEINEILSKLAADEAVKAVLQDGVVDSSEEAATLTDIAERQVIMARPLITPDETDALQAHFKKAFPDDSRLYRSSRIFGDFALTMNRPKLGLNPAHIKPGFEGVLELVDQNSFIFIGENHLVDDEKLFAEKMAELKEAGVRFLAVELADSYQKPLESYLTTNNSAVLERELRIFPDLFALISAAHNVGIKIVCADQPFEEQDAKDPEVREQYIVKNLENLKGKTIVWFGTAHAALDRTPYRTARTILADDGKPTAGIKLEPRAAETALATAGVYEPRLQTALNAFYPEGSPEEVTGYSTDGLSSFHFTDSTHPDPNHTNVYSQAFDLVLFLPEAYAKQSIVLPR